MKRFTTTITILLFLLLSSLTVIGQTTNIYINGVEFTDDISKYFLYEINSIQFLINRETMEFSYYGRYVNIEVADPWSGRWSILDYLVSTNGLMDYDKRNISYKVITDKYGDVKTNRINFETFGFNIKKKVYDYNKKQTPTNDVSIMGTFYFYRDYDYTALTILEEDAITPPVTDTYYSRGYLRNLIEDYDEDIYVDEISTKIKELKDSNRLKYTLFIPLNVIDRMYEESVKIYNDDKDYNRACKIPLKMFLDWKRQARISKVKYPMYKE
ncbi:hypothetical protein [Brachyspira pilosicoli]|uniref:hypothetical protein n=1 Tax=Brachyspira pilosicoli TaxID=52584 RepID=UPI000C756E11|nr:hypothetical protein [Brachyspira pilosicoli]PLV55294.1 hypothetical protein BPSP16_12225 [Brachyspira pilosicoli SP16]